MDVDEEMVAEQVEDALEAFGSTVRLAGGVSLQAIKVTNEKEMAKILRVDGETPNKLTSVFLFDRTAAGIVTKGTRIVNKDGPYICDMIHTEMLNDQIIYIGAGSYEAN